jgi:transcriptional regulator with XRE-family HTH domain
MKGIRRRRRQRPTMAQLEDGRSRCQSRKHFPMSLSFDTTPLSRCAGRDSAADSDASDRLTSFLRKSHLPALMAADPTLVQALQRAFGRRLQEARTAKGRDQRELSGALRLTRTSVSNLERGKQRVSLDQVYEAARFLGVPVSELLPPLAEVLPPTDVHEPEDDPLSERGKELVRQLSEELRAENANQRPRSRRARSQAKAIR